MHIYETGFKCPYGHFALTFSKFLSVFALTFSKFLLVFALTFSQYSVLMADFHVISIKNIKI